MNFINFSFCRNKSVNFEDQKDKFERRLIPTFFTPSSRVAEALECSLNNYEFTVNRNEAFSLARASSSFKDYIRDFPSNRQNFRVILKLTPDMAIMKDFRKKLDLVFTALEIVGKNNNPFDSDLKISFRIKQLSLLQDIRYSNNESFFNVVNLIDKLALDEILSFFLKTKLEYKKVLLGEAIANLREDLDDTKERCFQIARKITSDNVEQINENILMFFINNENFLGKISVKNCVNEKALFDFLVTGFDYGNFDFFVNAIFKIKEMEDMWGNEDVFTEKYNTTHQFFEALYDLLLVMACKFEKEGDEVRRKGTIAMIDQVKQLFQKLSCC